MIKNSFYEVTDKSTEYLVLLLKLLKTCINTRDYVRKDVPPIVWQILQEEEEELETDDINSVNNNINGNNNTGNNNTKATTTTAIPFTKTTITTTNSSTTNNTTTNTTNNTNNTNNNEKPLQRVYTLLYQRSGCILPASITTTAGVISPLGFFRLRCVEFVATLVKLNYHVLDTGLIENRVISRCMDLFFQYKWNNILHTIIEQLALSILELKPSYMCLYLLRDCHLVDRILQVQQNEEQEKAMKFDLREKYAQHQGYMGHLYRMANAIESSSKVHSAIYYLLQDVPNRAWKKFAEVKLKQINSDWAKPANLPKVEKKGGFGSLRD